MLAISCASCTSSGCAAALEKLVGPPSSALRQDFVSYTARALGTEWRESQRQLLLSWQSEVLVCDCAPGSGKSTILKAIILQVLRPLPSAEHVKLIVSVPNKDLAKQTLEGVCACADAMGLPRNVTRIGSKNYVSGLLFYRF